MAVPQNCLFSSNQSKTPKTSCLPPQARQKGRKSSHLRSWNNRKLGIFAGWMLVLFVKFLMIDKCVVSFPALLLLHTDMDGDLLVHSLRFESGKISDCWFNSCRWRANRTNLANSAVAGVKVWVCVSEIIIPQLNTDWVRLLCLMLLLLGKGWISKSFRSYCLRLFAWKTKTQLKLGLTLFSNHFITFI